MTLLNKIDSNVTGLRYCVETSIGVLPVAASQIWYPLEPNSYANFGALTKLTQRSPITDTRQRPKGVLTDLDAAGGINVDMTLTNYQRLMQGFMFAEAREKFDTASFNGIDTPIFAVAATSTFKLDYGDQLGTVHAGSLVLTTGFSNSANNGLLNVASTAEAHATGVLTGSGEPSDGDTVTIGTRVYTWQTTLTAVDGHVHIGGSESAAYTNLNNAINNSGGVPGTDYFVTAADPLVTSADVSSAITVTSIRYGYGLNTIPTTTTTVEGAWGASTLSGGTANIVVTQTSLVNEASPPAAARIQAVGVQFTSGDATITNSGSAYPTFNTTTFDLTTLGLIPGEFWYVGGDTAASAFGSATDNGFQRIRAITAHSITLDKTSGEAVTDAGTAKTIQVFFGKVIKNEANTDGPNGSIPIVRTTYQLERTLGSPDLTNPTAVQADYLVGSVPSKFKVVLKGQDKVTSDLDFVSLTNAVRTTSQGPLSIQGGATAPALTFEDAFNTTSNIARIRIAALSATDADPTALVGYLENFDFTIDNMLKPNKALGILGAFEVTAGHFTVNGTMKAYFSTVAAQEEVKQNGNITFDCALVLDNSGVLFDMPFIALSDGRPDVVSDEPIMLPLNVMLAPDPLFNHELLWCFYNYLPSIAQPVV